MIFMPDTEICSLMSRVLFLWTVENCSQGGNFMIQLRAACVEKCLRREKNCSGVCGVRLCVLGRQNLFHPRALLLVTIERPEPPKRAIYNMSVCGKSQRNVRARWPLSSSHHSNEVIILSCCQPPSLFFAIFCAHPSVSKKNSKQRCL